MEYTQALVLSSPLLAMLSLVKGHLLRMLSVRMWGQEVGNDGLSLLSMPIGDCGAEKPSRDWIILQLLFI